jgi:glycogen debranching enzyme
MIGKRVKRAFSLPLLALLLWHISTSTLCAGVEEYALTVPVKGDNSAVMTNRQAGFIYVPLNHQNWLGHMGWTIAEQKVLRRFSSAFARETADSLRLRFDGIWRFGNGQIENTLLVDSLDLLQWQAFGERGLTDIELQFADDLPVDAWQKKAANVYALPTRRKWQGPGFFYLISDAAFTIEKQSNNTLQVRLRKNNRLLQLVGLTKEEAAAALEKRYPANAQRFLREKGGERLRFVERSLFRSSSENLNLAVAWAKVSLRDLVMEQSGRGIFAGLPWFNNYWGRDTFISFSGAILCSGELIEGAEIIRSFTNWQNTDPADRNFGRVPNRVTIGEKIYNTTDGTPWLLLQIERYLQYGGDARALGDIFPFVSRALDGALANYTDEQGFLYHDDADTWMDAKGSKGPWSPRGDRAVEIQVLWMRALESGIRLARLEGQLQKARQWQAVLDNVNDNFIREFWSGEGLYDHLNSDGSPDLQVRPNQIFAVSLGRGSILSVAQERILSKTVFNKLVFPYGVTSLYQYDRNFHPWHHYRPFYVQDAAYHNGIIWTWNAGPVISALAYCGQSDNAFALLTAATTQILQRGAIGTQSELLDAMPRLGEKQARLSGTVSQAWNLAEFVRNIHEDVMGIRPFLQERKIAIAPLYLPALPNARLRQPLGLNDAITLAYEVDGAAITYRFLLEADSAINLAFQLPESSEEIEFLLVPEQLIELELQFRPQHISWRYADNSGRSERRKQQPWNFARPLLDVSLAALAGPPWPLLANHEIGFQKGTRRIFYGSDASGDDQGMDGQFRYPRHPNFAPGIFDIREVDISRDSENLYFRIKMAALKDTGYRPELGFDMLMLALLLDVRQADKTKFTLGRNSGLQLGDGERPRYSIFIGNGIMLRDEQMGEIMAEYRPLAGPFKVGDVQQNEVRFALPARFFEDLDERGDIIIISGGLDDHGGDGVGEFRQVRTGPATDWLGGGKTDDNDTKNYYDYRRFRR